MFFEMGSSQSCGFLPLLTRPGLQKSALGEVYTTKDQWGFWREGPGVLPYSKPLYLSQAVAWRQSKHTQGNKQILQDNL